MATDEVFEETQCPICGNWTWDNTDEWVKRGDAQALIKALSLALKTIEDLQGHKVTARDFQELMDNVNKIERG